MTHGVCGSVRGPSGLITLPGRGVQTVVVWRWGCTGGGGAPEEEGCTRGGVERERRKKEHERQHVRASYFIDHRSNKNRIFKYFFKKNFQ